MPGAGRRGPGPPGCVVVAAACTSLSRRARGARGGVREWLNRAVSKTVVWATPAPRVRIPPPPPKQGVLRSVGLLTGSTRHSGCRSLFGRSDSYDVISIDAEPGTSGAALAKAIKPMLPTNLQVKDVAGGASEAEADWKARPSSLAIDVPGSEWLLCVMYGVVEDRPACLVRRGSTISHCCQTSSTSLAMETSRR